MSWKTGGGKDVLIICADGLTGIKEAIAAAFPKTEYQRCIVHHEYYGAAEPPVRCGESHLSGLTEPPHFVY